MKKRTGMPGGKSLDLINRVSRCLTQAASQSRLNMGHDLWYFFDNPYGGIKKVHELVLVTLVRDEDDKVSRFHSVMEDELLEMYGVDFDVHKTLEIPTRVLGSPYSIENVNVNAVYRTYVLWRIEADRPARKESDED